MNILSLFAQSDQYYTTYNPNTGTYTTIEPAFVAAVLLIFLFALLIGVIVYIFISFCLMKIFKKAGVKPWIAWVPIYNNWKLLEIGGQPGFWSVLTLFPVINLVSAVFLFIAMYHVGKKLGKDSEFILWAIFLPLVWYPWLAFDKSTWKDARSTAPSLHHA